MFVVHYDKETTSKSRQIVQIKFEQPVT